MASSDTFFIRLALDGKGVQNGAFDAQKAIEKIGKSATNLLAGPVAVFGTLYAGMSKLKDAFSDARDTKAIGAQFGVGLDEANKLRVQSQALGISVAELINKSKEFALRGDDAGERWRSALASIDSASKALGQSFDKNVTEKLAEEDARIRGIQAKLSAISANAARSIAVDVGAATKAAPALDKSLEAGVEMSKHAFGTGIISAILGPLLAPAYLLSKFQSSLAKVGDKAPDTGAAQMAMDKAVAQATGILGLPAIPAASGSFSGVKPTSDSLSRIGLFRGGPGDQTVNILKQQVVQLQGIRTVINQVHSDLSAYDGADTLT